MVDRRLLGTLAIAAIISSAVVSLIFTESVEETIQVLRNDWQVPISKGHQQLPIMESRYPYSLGLVVRRPVVDLVLEFGFLRNQTTPINYTGFEGLSLKEKALTFKEVRAIDEKVSELGEVVAVEARESLTTVEWEGKKYDLYLLDYTSSVEALAPLEASSSLPTLFAFLYDSSGNLTQYYKGFADFFADRLNALEDLTIGLNENSTTYVSKGAERPGYLPIEKAPGFGKIKFQDLNKDDRISVLMAINGARVGGRQAIMQVISIRLDGEYLDPIVNVLIR